MKHRFQKGNKFSPKVAWNKGRKETRVVVLQRQSNSHFGKKHSLESREKIRLASLGEKNHNWKKDRTVIKRKDKRGEHSYVIWKNAVKSRDNNTCKLKSNECSHGRLEAHHIFNHRNYPELRFIISNGITLCRFHHPLTPEEETRMIPIFQELIK